MKITLIKTTEVEVDVTFPVYKRFLSTGFIKVVSENLTIHVSLNESINKYSISDRFLTDADYSDSNSDEFENALEQTILEFKTLAQ